MRSIRTTLIKLSLLALVGGSMLFGLNACGQYDDPQPPGPTNKVTYPQPYPPE
ncbi:MAG: hypothetical protein M3Z59_04555 [Bombella apis]|nr:hypothetical protein [Bombella apis]